MNKNKLYSQELVEKSLTLTDSLSELNAIIEKINFRTERGKLTAEIDISIIKVMMDVIHTYIVQASEISRNLPELSDDILTEIKDAQ